MENEQVQQVQPLRNFHTIMANYTNTPTGLANKKNVALTYERFKTNG